MKTIYTTLPIYDSVLKQDINRSGCIIPIYTPRHRLPSWQYNAQAVAVGAVTRIDLVNNAGVLNNITTYFPTLSDDYALTTDTYYKYDGDTLNYLLPYGAYYLKITHANGYYFYSEWFVVTDIYPKLSEGGFTADTAFSIAFTSSGTAITRAADAGGGASCHITNPFTVIKGEVITCITYLTNAAGELPTFSIMEIGGGDISNAEALSAGLNVLTFTVTDASTVATIGINNSNACDWSCTEIYVIRSYSPNFIRIDFHDTHDLGDIVYQNGFTQSLWLQTQLNTPQHEPVLIGEEKNGIFITEKIVTKFKFRIVTYVGPVFYRALIRLPQHDTITITDEVGFTYSPSVGNIQVNPINWNAFDYGTLEIIFNDNSEFDWTSEKNNLT